MAENNSFAPLKTAEGVDPRTPADMRVNGGALKLALNVLRRAGKSEVADELEKTAVSAVAAQAAPAAVAVPPKAITASLMLDDGGERPVYCLMAAYPSEADARAALAALCAAPAEVQAEPVAKVLGWVRKNNGEISSHFHTYEPHCDRAVRDYGGEKIAVVAVTTPQAHPADALDAETIKKAARYDWIREQGMLSDGSRHPHSWRCVALLADMGGERADEAIDAAMAAAQEGNKQ